MHVDSLSGLGRSVLPGSLRGSNHAPRALGLRGRSRAAPPAKEPERSQPPFPAPRRERAPLPSSSTPLILTCHGQREQPRRRIPGRTPVWGWATGPARGQPQSPDPGLVLKASVPQGASRCSTRGTGNRKRRASSGQLLLPPDPAACDHRAISPLSPSRSPGRSQTLIGQEPGHVAPPPSHQLQSLPTFSSRSPPFRGAFLPMGSRSPASGLRALGVTRGHARGHAAGRLPGRSP